MRAIRRTRARPAPTRRKWTEQKVTRPFRLSVRRSIGEKSCGHERPRDEWIEIPVPAIVSEQTFALAAEGLATTSASRRAGPSSRHRPGIGLVPQMRLRAVAVVNAQLRAQDPSSSLPRLRRVAPSQRPGVRLPTGPPGPARPDRVAGGRPPDQDPTLIEAELTGASTRPAPPNRRGGAGRSANASDADQEEHGALADGLSGGPLVPRRIASPDAGAGRSRTSMLAETQAILDQAADRVTFCALPKPLTHFLGGCTCAAIAGDRGRRKIVRLLVQRHPGGH